MSRRPPASRRFDDATVLAIRQADTSLAQEAQRQGCSRELIRQIRSGLIYRHLLPEGFVPGTVSCLRCIHWGDGGCTLGHEDPIEEGPQFARECAAYAETTP